MKVQRMKVFSTMLEKGDAITRLLGLLKENLLIKVGSMCVRGVFIFIPSNWKIYHVAFYEVSL